MDLDRFDEIVTKKGWSRYSPNIITGTLTNLIEDFMYKWFAVHIYGLNREKGTEEVVLEVVTDTPQQLIKDLEEIRRTIGGLGASISIVVVCDGVVGKAARTRAEAYRGTPLRRRAYSLLRKIKRMGGNKVVMG